MWNPVFWGKNKKIIVSLSSAEFTKKVVQVQDVSRRYYFTDDAFLEAMSLYRTGTTLLLKVSISSLKFEVSILIIIFCFRFPETKHKFGRFRNIKLLYVQKASFGCTPWIENSRRSFIEFIH